MAVPIIVMGLGVLITVRAIILFQRLLPELKKQSEKCEAIVSKVDIVDLTNEHAYRMTFEAQTASGKKLFKDTLTRPHRMREGRKVTLSYEPGNTKNFRVGLIDRRMIFPVAILFMGCVITVIGIAFMASVL